MFEKTHFKKMHRVVASIAAMSAMFVTSSASADYTDSDGKDWSTPSLGSNPGNLGVFEYVPTTVPTGTYVGGVVVLLHGCGQHAAEFASESGWVAQADLHGFSIIAPQQNTGNNRGKCFNWHLPEHQRRGSGEPESIIQMIESFAARTPGRYDADNVKVSGFSAGGAMTAGLLALYPDVFSGAAIISGVPFRCATDLGGAFSCMDGTSDSFSRTAKEWGDAVRYARHRPPNPWVCLFGGSCAWTTEEWPANRLTHVSIFGGTEDPMVVSKNADALVKQWTSYFGLDDTSYLGPFSVGVSRRPASYSAAVTHTAKLYGPEVFEWTHVGGEHDVSIAEDASCGRTGQAVEDMGLCSTTWSMAAWGW